MNRIFLGYDTRLDIDSRVLRYSLLKHASQPLDVRFLVLKDLDFKRPQDPLASTEFTYTRFLVPHLCGFQGRALFMDSDMLCLSDIMELFNMDLSRHWLRVVKHDHNPTSQFKLDGRVQTRYPRKNWSSLMLMNCEKLTVWTKENVETRPAAWLHRFEPIPDERIGDLPKEHWNVLDYCDDKTKLIHYTEGGPWFEDYRDHPYGDIWYRYRDEFLATPEGREYLKSRGGAIRPIPTLRRQKA